MNSRGIQPRSTPAELSYEDDCTDCFYSARRGCRCSDLTQAANAAAENFAQRAKKAATNQQKSLRAADSICPRPFIVVLTYF